MLGNRRSCFKDEPKEIFGYISLVDNTEVENKPLNKKKRSCILSRSNSLTVFTTVVITFCRVSLCMLFLIADCHMLLHLLSKMKQMAPLISESIIYHIQIPQRLCVLI